MSNTGQLFLNRNHIHTLPNIILPRQLIELFESISVPLFSMHKHNVLESHTITQLRDTLLPKLLLGELMVSAAKEMV